MGYTEQLCEGLKISEKERDKRAYFSTLFQNAVSALDVDVKFCDANGTIDADRAKKWDTVYRMTLHLIVQGDYDTIMRIQEEEGKKYLIDDTDPLTVEAWVYISKFFTIVYKVWCAEQETARLVPIAKYLEKIATPQTPYYHNWIRTESQDKAWEAALVGVTSLINTLEEESFITLCIALQNDTFITGKDGTIPQEARAVQYMTRKYLDYRRERLAEKHASLTIRQKLFDCLFTE